ncbi:high mobility group protein B4, putative [Plasmodium vinckei brucechwatti]|uniref:High mobility group protein B4, putative n=1 Tax=Plasmodium vinckei brucechwatti TaxID=119398 RepID=A0A6V7SBG6_PLAVN|nr:high mobility group protein B4, putative [Plasmodium vinckei brucechwatti]
MDRKKPKAPLSSYLIFCNYERENVKQYLMQNLDPNTTIKITDIQKELSNKWKNLSDDERKVYEEQAQLLKLKYNEELIEWQKSRNKDVPINNITNITAKFPTLKIQKIMHLNKNVKKVNGEAMNIFQKAVPRTTLSFIEEEDNHESIFDLCEEDKKEYNYDIEEKNMIKMKKRANNTKSNKKALGNQNIYADITTFFKKK